MNTKEKLQNSFSNTTALAGTYGIEVEFVNRSGLSHYDIADMMSDYLQEIGSDEKINACSYGRGGSYNNNDQWAIHPDSSCGLEMPTPILTGEHGLQRLELMIEVLKIVTGDQVSVNSRCGLHVHLGKAQFSDMNHLTKFVANYMYYEPAIDKLVPESRRGNQNRSYASSIHSPVDQKAIKSGGWETGVNGIDKLRYEKNAQMITRRGAKINITGYKPTIEVRHHSGSLNIDKISTWVRFLDFMVRWSGLQETRVPNINIYDFADDIEAYTHKVWKQLLSKMNTVGQQELATAVKKRARQLS